MGERVKCLGTAALVTVIDTAVVTYYGDVVWKAFAGVIWSKLLVLLLAALWATTLPYIWIHACAHLRQDIEGLFEAESIPVKGLQAQFAEEFDV